MNDTTIPPSVNRREPWLVALLLGIFLIINCLTAVDYPHVWTDEVMYTDPAANYIAGRGFTSTMWYAQTGDRFFAGNTPLHAFVLIEWGRLFGISPRAVRSLNYVWFALGTLLVWRFCNRIRLIENTRFRLLFIFVIACAFGFSFSYRSGRPDMIGYALLALSLCIATLPRLLVRYTCLLILGFLLPWAGLQLLPLLAITTALILIFFGVRASLNGVALGVGAALGLLGLYWFYSSHGVWKDFLASISPHTAGGLRALVTRKTGIFGPIELFMRDRSAPPLMILAVIGAARAFRSHDRPTLQIILFGLAAAVFIPLGLNLLGVFPLYYGWMAMLPLVLMTFHLMASRPFQSRWLKGAAFVLVAAAVGIGLPLRLLLAELQFNERPYSEVDNFVSTNLVAADQAYIDFTAYYPAWRTAAKIINIHYLKVITPDERAALTALVIDPDHFIGLTNRIPGDWTLAAEFSSQTTPSGFSAFIARRLRSQQAGVNYAPYHLAVYRKNRDHPQSIGP